MKKTRSTQFRSTHLIAALAALTLVVVGGAIGFRASLSDISRESPTVIGGFKFEPTLVPTRLAQTYDAEAIESEWSKMHSVAVDGSLTLAQKSARVGLQPDDPGILADLVIVGTYTGETTYRYKTFINNIKIDRVIRLPSHESALLLHGLTYEIPELGLSSGDIIQVYDEFAIQGAKDAIQTGEGMSATVYASSTRSPYTSRLPPMRSGQQYLLFLNFVPKEGSSSVGEHRFSVSPTLYGRIPIYSDMGKTPSIFDAQLPENPQSSPSEAAPFGVNSGQPTESEYDDAYARALDDISKLTFGEAQQRDLFVESPAAERAYVENCAAVLKKYLE